MNDLARIPFGWAAYLAIALGGAGCECQAAESQEGMDCFLHRNAVLRIGF